MDERRGKLSQESFTTRLRWNFKASRRLISGFLASLRIRIEGEASAEISVGGRQILRKESIYLGGKKVDKDKVA